MSYKFDRSECIPMIVRKTLICEPRPDQDGFSYKSIASDVNGEDFAIDTLVRSIKDDKDQPSVKAGDKLLFLPNGQPPRTRVFNEKTYEVYSGSRRFTYDPDSKYGKVFDGRTPPPGSVNSWEYDFPCWADDAPAASNGNGGGTALAAAEDFDFDLSVAIGSQVVPPFIAIARREFENLSEDTRAIIFATYHSCFTLLAALGVDVGAQVQVAPAGASAGTPPPSDEDGPPPPDDSDIPFALVGPWIAGLLSLGHFVA